MKDSCEYRSKEKLHLPRSTSNSTLLVLITSFPALRCFAALISFIAFKVLLFLAALGFRQTTWAFLAGSTASELQCRDRRSDEGGSGDALWICEHGSLRGGSAIEFG